MSQTSSSWMNHWFWRYLGSMNLAITLLVLLAVASIVGTILKQNQSYGDYILKFGSFWFEVYEKIGLYDMYSASWFLLVLIFLLLSTSLCVLRNAPAFLKDMKNFQENLARNSLKHLPHQQVYEIGQNTQAQKESLSFLQQMGYKVKTKTLNDGVLLAGMKGQYQRYGYILTHIAIVIICLGAVLDSKMELQIRSLFGQVKPETRAMAIKDIPPESQVDAQSFSFRANVDIPEGKVTKVAFLSYKDGYLVQHLPFEITLKDFRISHYDNGQPKDYESDIILTAPDLKEPIEATLKVNHPLIYKDYAIYQSSFGDGGSLLNLKLIPLLSPTDNATLVDSAVNEQVPLKTPAGEFTLEFNDFRLFNIETLSEEEQQKTGKKVRNMGPLVQFKLRKADGSAIEYQNYLAPVIMDSDHYVYLSGVRFTPAESFRYLQIPADNSQSMDRFLNFLRLLNDPQRTQDKLTQLFNQNLADVPEADRQLRVQFFTQLTRVFRKAGFEGIETFIRTKIPAEKQNEIRESYFDSLSQVLRLLYMTILSEEKGGKAVDPNDFDIWFFDTAIAAINALGPYESPFFVKLEGFKQIESSGLQITKSPGKDIVYFGSVMLSLGVMIMIFMRQQRLWVWIDKDQLVIAGRDNKNTRDFAKHFELVNAEFAKKFPPYTPHNPGA